MLSTMLDYTMTYYIILTLDYNISNYSGPTPRAPAPPLGPPGRESGMPRE